MVLAALKICHVQELDKYIGIPYEAKCRKGSNSLKGDIKIRSSDQNINEIYLTNHPQDPTTL